MEALIGDAKTVLTRRHVTSGLGGRDMTREMIQTAQEYLTMKENGKNRKIVNIDRLLRSHPSKEIIDFLKTILKEKQIALKDFILADKTKKEIDDLID